MTKKAPIEWRNIRAPLSRVIPWEHNPKHISKDRAERLLKLWDDLGQFQTIAVGPGFELYDGHQRYNVLTAAHGSELEVDMRQSSRPLTKKERERLIVESHATATGSFDWDMLANEFDPKDLEAYGLGKSIAREWKSDLANLEALVRSSKAVGESEPETDRADELRVKWGVESGQLWQLGDHRLICGDCTDRAVVERVMDGERADATFADAPYNINMQRSGAIAGDNQDLHAFYSFLSDVCGSIAVASMDAASVYICIGFREYPALANIARGAWKERNCIVSRKPSIGLGGNGGGLRYQHELIWFGGDQVVSDRSLGDVWDFDRDPSTIHPTLKPVPLIEKCLTIVPTSIVFDPFSGSGTTLIACERLGRKCRAIEIDPGYVAVALERWHVETGKRPKLIGRH